MTLDAFRAKYAPLGFGAAVYAYDPSGEVTVEIHSPDGSIFTATAATEAAAFSNLFPEEKRHEPPSPAAESVFD
jgi:hypothetical protein